MILKLNNVSKSFQSNPTLLFKRNLSKKVAIDNVSFEVNKGDCIALIGKNGSGKTTLLKIV